MEDWREPSYEELKIFSCLMMSCGGGELWDEVIKAKYGGWQRRLGDNGPSYKQSFWWRDLAKICWNNSSVGWFNSNVEWKVGEWLSFLDRLWG